MINITAERKIELLDIADEIFYLTKLTAAQEGYTRDLVEIASEHLPKYLTDKDCDFILGCIQNYSFKLAGLI